MIKFDSNLKVLTCCFLLLAVSCTGIYIPDPIDPRLPKYTENGHNVAGAFVQNEIWESIRRSGVSTSIDAPKITASTTNDSLTVLFQGRLAGDYSALEFRLKSLNITKFEDLFYLEGKKITLDGITNQAVLIGSKENEKLSGGIGQIYFKSTDTNKPITTVTLSGTFGFSVKNASGKTIEVSYGRFDYRIGKSSDFILE